jgi:hypothetical protein
MREKVAGHYRAIVRKQPQYMPKRMAELAPGVIAIEDEAGECDVMFNTEEWAFRYPDIWGDQKPMLKGDNMSVLEGVACSRPIMTIEEMVVFAKRHLIPTRSAMWHPKPQFFEF